jgi:hypothetical protein
MKYSPIDENIFITVSTEGYIRVYENENRILSSTATIGYDSARYASFSHDGLHVIFTNYTVEHEILSIIPYNELLRNNINEGTIFNLNTDHSIINFVVSPNYNHIAIFFRSNNTYSDPINGEIDIHRNGNKYFLNIYDFTLGHFALIFQKDFNNQLIAFTLSEFNTIAIASINMQNDEDDDGHELWEIEVYNIIVGNRIYNHFVDYTVKYIQYFPQIEPNDNRLLLISYEYGNTQIKILDLESNFRQISNVDTERYALSATITQDTHIVIGTIIGLYYYTSLDEDPRHLLEFHNIQDISFSRSGQKVAVRIQDDNSYDGIHFGYHIMIFNLADNTILFPRQQQIEDEEEEWEDLHREDEEEENIVIDDPELDACFIPPTNPQKLQVYANKKCFDVIQMNEENIGQYLSADRDNIVIFYKQPTDVDFLATCLTFTGLKKYLKDPKHAFYSCEDRKDPRTYYTQPPEFLKIPTQSHTIFVSYQDIKQKYIQRQNMIFLEFNERVETTITYEASITMNFVSCNHCQEGSIINVYRIIF